MEDDNGLELSLCLAWCQSSSKSKDIGDNSSDLKADEGDRSSKLINDFKHFLEGGNGKLKSGTGSQRGEPSKPEERGLWISNDNKHLEAEEVKGPESSNKRKFFFERESNNFDVSERSRQSYISINTDDGSTAENEDVADSEVVGTISRMVSHHENNGKKHNRGAGPFETGKEVYTVFDTSAVDVSGQRGFSITPEKEFRAGKMPYSVTYPSQSVNILNMPGNVSATFGYSPVQLPVLDKDNSRGLVSHLQQLHSSYPGRLSDLPSRVSQVMPTSEALPYTGTESENTKNERKLHARNGGSKEESDKLPCELSSIKPGIACDLKFGGSGSYPNLPWVSTKGPGPNGRIISGVTYKFNSTQIKIVCACHGSHMSPEEFVRHAGEEKRGTESESGLASLPSNNTHAASAQS